MPNIQSMSEFGQKMTTMIAEINETGNSLVLTQDGKATAVVTSYSEWEKTRASLAMMQLLTVREREAEDGNVVDFDSAMDAIDDMIRGHDEQ